MWYLNTCWCSQVEGNAVFSSWGIRFLRHIEFETQPSLSCHTRRCALGTAMLHAQLFPWHPVTRECCRGFTLWSWHSRRCQTLMHVIAGDSEEWWFWYVLVHRCQAARLQSGGHRVQTYAHLDVILLACQAFVEGSEEKSCCNFWQHWRVMHAMKPRETRVRDA